MGGLLGYGKSFGADVGPGGQLPSGEDAVDKELERYKKARAALVARPIKELYAEAVEKSSILSLLDLEVIATKVIGRLLTEALPLSGQKCGNCRFWRADDPDDDTSPSRQDRGVGACRRYPPGNAEGEFPDMFPFEWCGEWRAKEA